MKCSTSTAEVAARKEWDLVKAPGEVTIRVSVAKYGHLILPRQGGDEEVVAIFKEYTFGDNLVIERATRVQEETDHGETTAYEPNEFRRLMLKKALLEWSLPIPIEREDGWLTPECYERVGNVGAPLIEALLDGYRETTAIDEEEEKLIERQCSVLFSENSRGVANACDAVSLFCNLSGFWEKFGINTDTIPSVPFKDYMRLRVVMKKEAENLKMRTKRNAPGGNVRIAGPGGRTRPSAGRRIPM